MPEVGRLHEVVAEQLDSHFEALDPDLVRAILDLHANYAENPAAAKQKTEELIRAWVNERVQS